MADVLLTHSYHLPLRPQTSAKDAAVSAAGHPVCRRGAARAWHFGCGIRHHAVRTPRRIPAGSEAALAKSCRHLRRRFQFSVEDVSDPNARGRMADDRGARRCGATVIVHGSDATDHAEDYLQHGANYVLLGEAEKTLDRTVLDPSHVRGASGVSMGWSVVRAARAPSAAGSQSCYPWIDLPNPARDLIDIEPYRRGLD